MIFRKVNRAGVVKCMKLFVVEMCFQVVSHIHIFDSKLYRHLWLPVLFFFLPMCVSVCAWRGGGCDVSVCVRHVY